MKDMGLSYRVLPEEEEASLKASLALLEHKAVEASSADSAETSIKAEAVKTPRQYVKRRPFLIVLVFVASALLLALVLRKQLHLVGKPSPTKPPLVFEKEPADITEDLKEEPSEEMENVKMELEKTPEKLMEAPEVLKLQPAKPSDHVAEEKPPKMPKVPEEGLLESTEVPKGAGPEQEPTHTPDVLKEKPREGSQMPEQLTSDYDSEEMAALLSEGVPKLVEKCRPKEDDWRLI
ncbi:hypothetical protein Emed_006186 [Eimeria media]